MAQIQSSLSPAPLSSLLAASPGRPADHPIAPVALDIDDLAVRETNLDLIRRAVVADLGLDDGATFVYARRRTPSPPTRR